MGEERGEERGGSRGGKREGVEGGSPQSAPDKFHTSQKLKRLKDREPFACNRCTNKAAAL